MDIVAVGLPTSCHGRRRPVWLTQGLVGSAEVVVHPEQGDHVAVVVQLLGEAVGQSRETAHGHPHREVMPLHVGYVDVCLIRAPGDHFL